MVIYIPSVSPSVYKSPQYLTFTIFVFKFPCPVYHTCRQIVALGLQFTVYNSSVTIRGRQIITTVMTYLFSGVLMNQPIGMASCYGIVEASYTPWYSCQDIYQP